MAKTTTTLVDVRTQSGASARGPWTMSIFKAADGNEYVTFKGEVASKANSLLNTAVEVEYSPGKDPVKYPNSYNLDGVTAVAGFPVDESSGQVVVKSELAPLVNKNDQFRTKEQIMRTDAASMTVTLFGVVGLDPFSGVDEFEGWLETMYRYIETGVFETPGVRVEA